VFGAKRLPEMGHSLGSGMRGFKDALSGQTPSASLTSATDEHAVAAAVPVSVTAPAPASPGAPEARS